jgi:hypothetical protein
MSQADKLFTDGEAYKRLMGRWSRLVAGASIGSMLRKIRLAELPPETAR